MLREGLDRGHESNNGRKFEWDRSSDQEMSDKGEGRIEFIDDAMSLSPCCSDPVTPYSVASV